jgi:hypothetical protein
VSLFQVARPFKPTFIKADMSYGFQIKDPQRQASELREKLLREKIKKMRTSSIESLDAQANAR